MNKIGDDPFIPEIVMGPVRRMIKRGRESFGVFRQAVGAESEVDGKIRKVFSECLSLDQILTYGSCVPFVSNIVGAFRILYGVSIAVYGVCEIINNIAEQNLKKIPVTVMASIKGGGLPCIAGIEHIIAGYSAQTGLFGNIGCIVYTLLRRNFDDPENQKEMTVDPGAFSTLFGRIQEQPLYKKVVNDARSIWAALLGLPGEVEASA